MRSAIKTVLVVSRSDRERETSHAQKVLVSTRSLASQPTNRQCVDLNAAAAAAAAAVFTSWEIRKRQLLLAVAAVNCELTLVQCIR